MLQVFSFLLLLGALINGLLCGFSPLNSVYVVLPAILLGLSVYLNLRTGVVVKLGKFKLGADLVGVVVYGIILALATGVMSPESPFSDSERINESARLLNAGKEKQAERILKKLYDKDQTQPLVNLNLGVVYLKAHKPDLVRQHLDAAQQRLSYDENLWYNYGLMYDQQEDYKNALKCFEKALQLNPNMANAAVYAGMASYKLGNIKRSIYHLEYAYFLKPDSPDILFNLGRAHFKMMNYTQSIEALNTALQLNPNPGLAASIQEQLAVVEKAKGGESL